MQSDTFNSLDDFGGGDDDDDDDEVMIDTSGRRPPGAKAGMRDNLLSSTKTTLRSPNKLVTCYQQADVRIRSHDLRQLVDDRSVESCQQTCCKLIVRTFYLLACYKLFQQVVTSLQMTSLVLPDLWQFDEINTFVATC